MINLVLSSGLGYRWWTHQISFPLINNAKWKKKSLMYYRISWIHLPIPQPTRELWAILCVSELFIMLVDKHINQWSIQFCWVDFSDQSNAWTLSDIEDRIYVTVWPSLMRKHVPTYTALICCYLSPSVYIQRVTKIYVFSNTQEKNPLCYLKTKIYVIIRYCFV